MRDREVGIVPVVDDAKARRLVGMITDRDIAIRCTASKHMPACDVSRHMTSEHLHTVSPDTNVLDVIALMKREQLHRIPVVSADNHLDGVISQSDIDRCARRD